MPLTSLRPGRQVGGVALAATLLLPGCGGGAGETADHPTPALRGHALVAGAAAANGGLLAVPRAGGNPALFDLSDPTRRLWTGAATLPPAAEVHPLGDRQIVLRTPEDVVVRYDPAADAASEVGQVGAGATWSGFGSVGAWTDPADTSALVVTGSDAWRADLPAPPLWVAPVGESGVAAIVAEGGVGRAVLIERPADASTAPEADGAASAASLRTPAAVTAWGRRMVAAAADGERLVELSVPELSVVSSRELEGPPVALAPSPSSHAFYLALGADPATIVAVGRLREETARLARIDGTVRELRTAVLGGSLLADAGETTRRIPIGGGSPVAIPGRWRADLPLGLPDGRVLVWTGDAVALWTPEGSRLGATKPLRGAPDAWWVALDWRPPAPERVAETEEPGAADTVREAEVPEADPLATTAGRAPEEGAEPGPVPPPTADPTGVPADTIAAPPGPSVGERVAPGFYAIVASAQQSEAIGALASRLDGAGFRTRVQRHRDEAGELWYRALVGPYETRPQAEAAARQLRRERGLQAWISEVGPDARPDDPS